VSNTELMKETLEEAFHYTGRVIAAIDDINSDLQTENQEKVMKFMVDLADGLKWLTDALTLTGSIQRNPVNTAELDGSLNEAVSAVGNKDYVLLGDILNYEVKPLLESWREQTFANINLEQ